MKYSGNVGYATQAETTDGVWSNTFIDRPYVGTVVRNVRRLQNGSGINDNVTPSVSVSIILDSYAYENYLNIRYLEWLGAKHEVTDVEVVPPRLILSVGGLYNDH